MWNSDYKSLQGNIGLGRAIAYFTNKGIPVMIPLNDTQKYDLVIDEDGSLKKVSIKTSSFSENNGFSYMVALKNCGGASGKNKIRNFDNTTCDYVFVLTVDSNMYLIPSSEINAKSAISVGGNSYNQHKVSF